MGPRREIQRIQQGLEVTEHCPSWQFSTALELLQLASGQAIHMHLYHSESHDHKSLLPAATYPPTKLPTNTVISVRIQALTPHACNYYAGVQGNYCIIVN